MRRLKESESPARTAPTPARAAGRRYRTAAPGRPRPAARRRHPKRRAAPRPPRPASPARRRPLTPRPFQHRTPLRAHSARDLWRCASLSPPAPSRARPRCGVTPRPPSPLPAPARRRTKRGGGRRPPGFPKPVLSRPLSARTHGGRRLPGGRDDGGERRRHVVAAHTPDCRAAAGRRPVAGGGPGGGRGWGCSRRPRPDWLWWGWRETGVGWEKRCRELAALREGQRCLQRWVSSDST